MCNPKIRCAGLLTVRLLVLCAASMACWPLLSPVRLRAEEPVQAETKSPKLKELLKERLATVRTLAQLETQKFKNGTGSIDQLREANRMVLETELELCTSDKERVAVLEKIVVEAKMVEKFADQLAKVGQGSTTAVLKAKADRLQAEITLERARAKGATRQGADNTSQELRDQVALAEKQVAIKRALVLVAEAVKKKAVARLNTLKARVVEAQTQEALAKKQVQRMEALTKDKVVDNNLVTEQLLKWQAATARRKMAEGALGEGESQVEVEQARIAVAHLEFQEAELRMKQLKARHQPD